VQPRRWVDAQLGRSHGLGQDLGFQEAEQQAVLLGADLLAGRDLAQECGDLGGQDRHV